MVNARLTAARLLAEWAVTGAFPDRLLSGREVSDRAFVTEVVYGVVRQRRLLDWLLARLAERPPEAPVRAFAWVGLYQLWILSGVAEHAAVHETVAAAKAAGLGRAAGFLNAVLRRLLRERAALEAALAQAPAGVRLSHPDVLLERWTAAFGATEAAALCAWNNERPGITVHPVPARIGMEAFRDDLAQAGIEAQPHPFSPATFLELAHGVRVGDVPGFAEGRFSVQDPSTRVAVDLLAPEPGDTVADICAAPGGKTVLVCERMEGRGRVLALDLHEDRLALLRDNLRRLRIGNVEVRRGDARAAEALADERFDRILLDVPCTNTGVLRRRPDARWRFTEKRRAALCRTQRELLDAVTDHVADGGVLVYSTCSLEREEGPEQVRGWLADHREFDLQEEMLIFPPRARADGAYAARLRRKWISGSTSC